MTKRFIFFSIVLLVTGGIWLYGSIARDVLPQPFLPATPRQEHTSQVHALAPETTAFLAALDEPTVHRILVIRVDFEDQRGQLFSADDFRNLWVGNLVNFFNDVSNGRLILQPTVLDEVVTMPARRFYHPGTLPLMPGEVRLNMWSGDDRPPILPEEAEPIASAIDAGLVELTGSGLVPAGGSEPFDSLLVVFTSPPGGSLFPPCGAGFLDHSFGNVSPAADPTGRRYQFAYSKEDGNGNCLPTVDPQDIGGAAHEVGHMVARNYGHPAGYANAYELMDSCYPCEPGIFSRTGQGVKGEGFSRWFDGWIPDEKVQVFAPPTGGTAVLAPVEVNPADTPAPMGLKVETMADGAFYMVECRRPLPADDIAPIPGQGVLILSAVAGRAPETRVMTRTPGDLATLWTPGSVFTDSFNDLRILIGPDVGDGCTVTVEYGVTSDRAVPDAAMIPWLTPPMNRYETVDIWVDSSCNGYEDEGGELKYGRRADGTVIGNGDDPCANRENRIYARIRNLGDAPANNVRVRIEVTDPLGVGIWGSSRWLPVGTATKDDFPGLMSIPAGGFVDVYVPWEPAVDDPAVFTDGAFNFHSCVRVIIETVTGEVITTNQDGDGEQENIDYFEAVRERLSLDYPPVEGHIFLSNAFNFPLDFHLTVESQLPEGWNLELADGWRTLRLDAGELISLPVRIEVPGGTPIGHTYFVEAEAYARVPIYNTSGEVVHYNNQAIGGVLLAAQTVEETTISLEATLADACPMGIEVSGQLVPAAADTVVSIDLFAPDGNRQTHQVRTDAGGAFYGSFPVFQPGPWKVSAFWQGNTTQASAGSEQQTVLVAGSSAFLVTDLYDAVDLNPGDGVCDTGQGLCSLRAAIQETNALPGCQTIMLPAGKYTLLLDGTGEDAAAVGDLDITDDVAITGAGAADTIVDGGGLDTVMDVVNESKVELYGFTISGGNGSGYPGGIDNDGELTLWRMALAANSSSGNAGGAWNSNRMTLRESVVRDNTAAYNGGGLYNRGGWLMLDATGVSGNQAQQFSGGGIANNGGTVSIFNSAVWGNYAADEGGGLSNDRDMTLLNTTISGNTAGNNGGGWHNAAGTAVLNNVTVAFNLAEGGIGGGLYIEGGTTSSSNSILADNRDEATTNPDCAGVLTSLGYNLIGRTAGCTITGDTTGNITNEAALLLPLANYGGLTPAHALSPASPAADGGNSAAPGSGPAACAETDQRGVGRPAGAVCDMGALELAGRGGWTGHLYLPAVLR